MQKNKFDISVIVTAHHEGRLAHRTMRSLFRSAEYAQEEGISIEIIVVMDKPDINTLAYFSLYENSKIIIKVVEFGDPGLSRNYGVEISSGKYVYFLDADNLVGRDWLYKAYQYLEGSNKDIIVHPEYHIVFEAKNIIWCQLSSFGTDFYIEDLMEYNYWDTVCGAKRDILLKYPFERTSTDSGFGYEDWHFNCQTLADGIEHHVVPETVHFLRTKKIGSRLAYDNQANRLIRPTRLFDPNIFSSMLAEKNRKKEIDNNNEKKSDSKLDQKKKIKHSLFHPISSLQNSL